MEVEDQLISDTLCGTPVVRDPNGGIWWPGEELLLELQELDEEERSGAALWECRRHPQKGTWAQ